MFKYYYRTKIEARARMINYIIKLHGGRCMVTKINNEYYEVRYTCSDSVLELIEQMVY